MIEYEYINNKIDIFDDNYMYKIILKGYTEEIIYNDKSTIAGKEYILFLISHSVKYELKITYAINYNKVKNVDIELNKVDEYTLPEEKRNNIILYYILEKSESNIKGKTIDSISPDILEKFLEKKVSSTDDCIASDNYLILLHDINIDSKYGFIKLNKDINVSRIVFLDSIL